MAMSKRIIPVGRRPTRRAADQHYFSTDKRQLWLPLVMRAPSKKDGRSDACTEAAQITNEMREMVNPAGASSQKIRR
jgi:hypothetical protein